MPVEAAVSRKKRLVKNGIFSAVSWFVPLALTFVVTPIVVRGLGHEIYGLYALILGFISYSFAFGVGKIAAKFVSEYRAAGESEKIAEIVSATVWFSLAIAFGGTMVVVLAARTIVDDLLAIPAEHHDTAVVAIYLACGTITVTMLSQIFQCVLQGAHRFDWYLLLTNLSAALLNLGSAALVLSGYGVVPLVAWNLIIVSVIAALFYFNARRLVPEFRLTTRVPGASWSVVARYGGSIILYQVFGNLIVIVERGWTVRHFGTESLTFYVVPMMLGMYLHGFVGSLVLVLFPVVNELLGDRTRLIELYKKATKLILAIAVFSFISAATGGAMLLGKWIGPEFAEVSYRLLVIHIATFAVLSVGTIAWQITEGFHRAGMNSVMAMLWFVISAPLIIVLSGAVGVEGVALARFAGVLVTIPMIYWVEKRLLGGGLTRFWLMNLPRLALAAISAGFVQWIAFSSLPSSWATLLFGWAAGFVGYATVLLVSGFFDREERAQFGALVFGR